MEEDMAKTDPQPKEVDFDYMKEAPKARPYAEAITDEHRNALKEAGFEVR